MNSLGRLRSTIFALLKAVLLPSLMSGQDSLLFGFRGGPENNAQRMTRVKGKTRYFRVALIWSCRPTYE